MNPFDWVEVRAEALADFVGATTLLTFGGDAAGLSSFAPAEAEGARPETVPVTTLDAVLGQGSLASLTMVKLDLEGAEWKALLGADRLLRERGPDLILELEDAHLSRQGSSAERLLDLLERYGYHVSRIWPEAGGYCLRPLSETETASPLPPNVLATRREASRAEPRHSG